MRRFFRLILRVAPGGSRKHEEWIAGTLGEIREFLREDLESGQGAYHALWYGEDIVLECWEGRTRVAAIDLHPHITLELGGVGSMPLAGQPAEATPEDGLEDEDSPLDAESLWDRVLDGEVAVRALVDWDRVPVPTMRGEPLAPGEEAEVVDQGFPPYRMAYGHHSMWG